MKKENQDLVQDKNEKGVLFLRMNRPEVHNAFNNELINKMIDVFISASNDKEVRIIVLSGTGKSFCAGADLNWMKSMKNFSIEENVDDSKRLALLFKTINDCPKPVIGKINGHALGGGVGLLSVCDFVHIHDRAKFGFTETRLGLIPAVISPYVVSKIGESMARAYFLSGEMFKSETAISMGLAHRVSSFDSFEEEFIKTIDSFLLAAPKASMRSKLLIKDVLDESLENKIEYTCLAISEQRISPEGQEGMTALLEKRSPKWETL
jgi:methylglutaconyl-CoA hydratase